MSELLKQAKFLGTKENANTFVLVKEFDLDTIPKQATIDVTALGIYFIRINGVRVGDSYLAPGWTSYNKMLQVQSINVKEYLREGVNKLEMVVNVGWYAGRLAWENNFCVFGKVHAGALELKLDDKIIATDETWFATSDKIISSSIYDGETIDFNEPIKTYEVVTVDYDKEKLVKQISESVKTTEVLAVKEVITTPSGDTVYDFGQNLTGVVEVTIPKDFKGNLELKFSEILIHDEFYTENLRSAKCTDFFINPSGIVCPEFTFHGFRYLHASVLLPASCFKAHVRHTDMLRTGEIHSTNPSFNKLMENVTWGQRGNFVDIPTDCPQRDERLGWTGDINAFARTACYNYDSRLILKKFLADLRNDQAQGGEIPHVAPDCLFNGAEPSALWSDVICFLPNTLYEMYGDLSFFRDNIEAMKKYIGALERRTKNNLIIKGQVYGDWLALDNEVVFKDSPIGRTDKLYLANVFYIEDCKIIEKTLHLLGDEKEAKVYKEKWQKCLEEVRKEYFNCHGKLMIDTITAQVIALHFNIVTEDKKEELATLLAANVKRHGYHVTTGFIGTAYLLFALAENNQFETAAKLMMNHEYPGWLYEVDMGATTTWERWSSLMPNGEPDSKGMNSYNHYAYGAMKEFVYRYVAGIEAEEPGFKKIKIMPHVVEGLDDIEAKYNSQSGLIQSSYKVEGEKVHYEFRLPKGIETEIVLPSIKTKVVAKEEQELFVFDLNK